MDDSQTKKDARAIVSALATGITTDAIFRDAFERVFAHDHVIDMASEVRALVLATADIAAIALGAVDEVAGKPKGTARQRLFCRLAFLDERISNK